MTPKTRTILLALVLAVLFVTFIWPTPYWYHNVNQRLYRINRFTGSTRIIAGDYVVPVRVR